MTGIFQTKAPLRGWRMHALPAILLIAVMAAEFATPDIRVTPSLMTIALACLSLVLPPRALAVWAGLLFLPVLASLLFLPVNGAQESPTIILLRCLAYVFVAVMAWALSRNRDMRERQFNSLLALLDSLRTPIVVSDEDGEVQFANRACCSLLGRGADEVRGLSFFTLFADPDRRGKAIEHYLALLGADPTASAELNLALRERDGGTTLAARCSVVHLDGRRLLVSQLHDPST